MPELPCPTPTLSAKSSLHHAKNLHPKFPSSLFAPQERKKDKKKLNSTVVGIAEGGARTLDLEVWKYLRR
jgi:hypothetical protein